MPADDVDEKFIGPLLARQANAALAMLREAVTMCEGTLWSERAYGMYVWNEAYHALYFMDHIARRSKEFRYDRFGYTVPEFPDQDGVPPPFTIAQFLEIADEVGKTVDALVDLPDSHFAGRKRPEDKKAVADGIVYGIRHVQAHVARISFILSRSGHVTVAWR